LNSFGFVFEKYIRDPIHGLIGLLPHERAIVDLPIYQRLRRVSQLGFGKYVYPSANHTRFEHSIGVMQTITDYYESLIKSDITDNDVRDFLLEEVKASNDSTGYLLKLRMAALFHDIGHPPFSHGLEAVLNHKHEEYSIALLEKSSIIDVLRDYGWSKKDFLSIKEILVGELGKEEYFLKSMINSAIDADRMDYLLRDSYHCGVKYGVYDYPRLLRGPGVRRFTKDGGEEALDIVFSSKVSEEVENFLLARYRMFTQVYLHKTYIGFLNALWQVYRWLKENEDNLGLLLYPDPNDKELERKLIDRDEIWFFSLLRHVRDEIRLKRKRFTFNTLDKDVLLSFIDSLLNRRRIKLVYSKIWTSQDENNLKISEGFIKKVCDEYNIPHGAVMFDDHSFIIYQTFKPEYHVYIYDKKTNKYIRIDQVKTSLIYNIAEKEFRYTRIYTLDKYYQKIKTCLANLL